MADSDPRSKKFRLRPHQIRPVATGRGACIATDRITVDGHPVCYAYREAPDFDVDSGWRFFAGDESQEYVDNPQTRPSATLTRSPTMTRISWPSWTHLRGRPTNVAAVANNSRRYRTRPSRTKTSGMDSLVRLSWACPNTGAATKLTTTLRRPTSRPTPAGGDTKRPPAELVRPVPNALRPLRRLLLRGGRVTVPDLPSKTQW